MYCGGYWQLFCSFAIEMDKRINDRELITGENGCTLFYWSLVAFISLFFSLYLSAQSPDFLNWKQNPSCVKWVDSVYNTLSPEERIGQFFMLAAYTQGKEYNMDSVLVQIKRGNAGGVIFFKGNPTAQALWTQKLQDSSKVNCFIAIDGEWGLSMRLDSTILYPKQMTLGAIDDNTLIYEMGRAIGRECKRIGVNINFAPCADINNNPNNPVINERSFGENKYKVALKALEYANGLQDEGILACAKHFPGHGDTDKDSHKELPSVTKSAASIDSFELYPFKILFNNGVGSVMVAHLNIPALDTTKGSAASISKAITTTLLKDSLGYTGLVFSDALNMKGVSKYYEPGTVDSIAFMAGCDILVFSEDAAKGIAKIKMAADSGTIAPIELEQRVKKVLAYKYLLGLNTKQQIQTENLYVDINPVTAQNLQRQLLEKAITIAANQDEMLPFRNVLGKKIASLSIGCNGFSVFQNRMFQYAEMQLFNQPNEHSAALYALIDTLAKFDVVIVDLHAMVRLANRDYNVTEETRKFAEQLSGRTKVVMVIFGNPYALRFFEYIPWLVCAYEETNASNLAAANALFGAQKITGRLPVTASSNLTEGTGYISDTVYRLKLSSPKEEGLPADVFKKTDDIIKTAIAKKAFPGCQLLVAKDGKVLLNKAYGNKTYELNDSANPTDIYDLASITKVAATTLAVMKLYEEKKIDLNDKVHEYLHLPHGATIRHLKLKDILTHQAGLKPFLVFWKETMGDNAEKYYRKIPEADFSIQVADSLFLRNDYADTMWYKIIFSEVDDKPKYVYSDLDFYILQKIVETVTNEPLDVYVNKTFYEPLGLSRLTFHPLRQFDRQRMAPTENDTFFRKQIVRGYVHDPGAAMYGGVAGHAGLFGNAFDLAQLFQMLLNGGIYNGKRILKESTIELFTARQSKISRRGYGFDKPEPDVSKPSPCYDGVPLSAFGHTGFTGTCVWADPENNLIYIFLSNRVYPNADNNLLVKLNVRTDLQEAIYKALVK